MKKLLSYNILTGVLLFYPLINFAQTTVFGGRGLMRVFSAETVQPGSFNIHSNFSFFVTNENQGPFLTKDYSFKIGLTYGISPKLELTGQIVAYQDDQKHVWGPPGNTQVGFKLALPFYTGGFKTAVRGFFIFPTAKETNVLFEPFTSDKVSWGLMGILTVDMTNSFPLFPLKAHLNIGYVDHNITTLFGGELTDQLLLGFGFKLPIRSVIFYTEYTGEIFYNVNNINFRNNSMRITPGIEFVGPFNFVLDLAVDIGLSQDLATYSFPLHEYADWKVIAGVSYQFLPQPKTSFAKKSKKHQPGSIDVEEVREKRKRTREALEEIKKKLEEDDKKPKNL